MKIKLSKSQWESMGKKAGWMKTAQTDNNELKQIKMWIQNNYQQILKVVDLYCTQTSGDDIELKYFIDFLAKLAK